MEDQCNPATETALEGAILEGAILDGADLRGVDLSGVQGLSAAQLESAITDETTRLPEMLSDFASADVD